MPIDRQDLWTCLQHAVRQLQVTPAHIGTVAEGLGLTPEDYNLYGTTKAKVCKWRLQCT